MLLNPNSLYNNLNNVVLSILRKNGIDIVASPTAHIPTMHNIQVQGKPFLQKAKDEAELQSQVQELLAKGLIRPSRSDYPCTTFIV